MLIRQQAQLYSKQAGQEESDQFIEPVYGFIKALNRQTVTLSNRQVFMQGMKPPNRRPFVSTVPDEIQPNRGIFIYRSNRKPFALWINRSDEKY